MFLRKKPKPTSTDRQAEPARKASENTRTKQSLLSLEPRLMFDAAAATTVAEVKTEQAAQEQAEAAVSGEADTEGQTAEQNESQNLLQAIATYNPGESTTEVIFVDPTVPDCQTLVAGIGLNAEVIMLDPTRDGVEQIAESLAGRSGIDAIHLISHGSSGELQLGAGTLTAESMSGEYADELATIRKALSDQADILVYGCDFAEGQDGQEAATLLSQLTGADVAASTDATGFAGLGGDWMLETQVGTIETQIAVDDGVQANWVGLLAGETPPTITRLSGDSRAYSEGAGAVVIEQGGNAVVADVDSPNLDTGTLTVSIPAGGDSAEDVLSIRNQGTGAGQIGVSGSTVTYGGTTIGTFAGGSSGSNLVITLNSNATLTAVTALVKNITYQNTDTDAPTTGARTVRFVLTDGDGGTSANYDTTVAVSAVNDAPVLTDTALSLTVAEDAGVPSGAVGSLVSTFTGGITDVDSGASKGIAITGSNQTNGTWYYTTDGGSTWTAVGSVSNTAALLLADNGSTRLYFAPKANYNGTSSAALTVRAWDQSSGTAGTKVSTASNGGTTAFSSATDTVDVTVTAVNDAPTITRLSGDSRAYSEGAGAVVIEQGGNAVVADVDSPNLDTGTLTVSIPAGGDSAEDVLSIRNQGTGAGQIGVSGSTVTYGGTTIGTFAGGSSGSNLVITLNSNATLTAVTALVKNITYQNTDTDAPTTGARTVRFVLTDGDGGTSANYDTTVAVSAVNDAPTSLSLSGTTVAENAANGTVVGTITGTDPDSGDTQSYSLTDTAGGRFAIDRATGVLTVANGSLLDYESAPSHSVTVRVTDSGGLTYDKTFTITLTDVNEAPTSLSLSGTTVAENAANGTVVGTITGTDPDSGDTQSYSLTDTAGGRFAIDRATGVLTVANGSLLDYESAPSHSVTVRVTDSGGLTYDKTFTITLTDVNEAPTSLSLSGTTVAENAANGTVVGTITGTDPDSGDTQSYSLTDTAGGRFAIDRATGVLTVANGSLLDYESAPSHSVTVRVTDSGGLTYDKTFTITLTDVNEAPTSLSLSGTTVAENAANGTVVGTVTGTDPDSGDTQSYSLTDTAGGRFAIDRATGVLTVANGSLLDYESAPSHSVSVRVTDSGGLTYDKTFTITLTDVNEAPTSLSLSGTTVAENAATGTVVGTVSGTDPDAGDTQTYSFTDSAGGRFAIDSSTGVLTVADSSLLDYESAPSHSVSVRVTDSGGLTYDETFTINLTNVNEAPTGADATVTINEDTSHIFTPANFGFSDVDAGDTMSAVRIDSVPSAGTLTLSGLAVTAGQVVTLTDITAGNLVFTPAVNANGTGYANVTFSVGDSNNTYDVTPNTLTFNVTAVNDAPVNQVPGAQTVNEDTPLSLSGLSVNDVDGNLSTVQLAVSNGTLNVTLAGAATITSGSNGTNILTLSGSQADLNATLASLVYQGSLNYTGVDTLTVTSTDSNAVTDVDTVAITVTAVNDAPTGMTLSGNTVVENAATGTVVGTVSAVDPDSGDTKAYTLTDSAGGRFAINRSTGVITVANGALLNYEAATSHIITVRVMDAGGLAYDKSFTITLTDAYEPLPFPSMSGSSVASHLMAIHENGTTLSSLPDVSSEIGKTEFRPPEDLRKAIEIMTETPPPIDTANLEEKHLGDVREQFFGTVESTTEEKEFLPAPVSESKTEGKVTAQDHGDSALLISDHHVDSRQLDRTSESAIGTTMAVGLAGVVLQGAMGTKERLIANIRRSREHTEGASPDMESELSSEDDSRSPRNESEHDGPISSKPDAA
ncbi:MAG: hypothetical protein OJF51_001259 [Nitrospira sp.]|jgi:VCBS repeat-containing protein|nr:MAG: hypothetical protein OJF51_001259 [Nitrospira sp.]